MGGTVHVVGAGLAGLAAAVRLSAHHRRVILWEAAPHAGGRARSFYDEGLGAAIDNGNHLMLSGNRAVGELVSLIGSQEERVVLDHARFPFLDVKTGRVWSVDLNAGRLPWWVFASSRRPPGTHGLGLLADAGRLMRARGDQAVTDVLNPATAAFRLFWEPLSVAVLNAPAGQGSARLLANVMAETLGRGGARARPVLARRGLSRLFADPALRFVQGHHGDVRPGARLKGIEVDGNRVAGFHVEHRGRSETVALGAGDALVLAVPPEAAASLLPGLQTPKGSHAIANVHFRLPDGGARGASILGLVGAQAHWLFLRENVASVTISAADGLIDRAGEDLAAMLWAEVCGPLGFAGAPTPPARVIKERRATFAATPANEARRPGTATDAANLFLAGDWTVTGLPATIEGAVRSGFAAAEVIMGTG